MQLLPQEQTDSAKDRYNRTIVQALATSSVEDDSANWDVYIKQVQSAMNTTHNKGIGTSPTEALMGYKPRPMAEAQILQEIQGEVERLDLAVLRPQIKAHITSDQAKQKERYDAARRQAKLYAKDDLVLVLVTSEPNTNSSKKLLPKFKGPFRVRRALFNDRYEVEDLREGHRSRRTVVAVENMKPWVVFQSVSIKT